MQTKTGGILVAGLTAALTLSAAAPAFAGTGDGTVVDGEFTPGQTLEHDGSQWQSGADRRGDVEHGDSADGGAWDGWSSRDDDWQNWSDLGERHDVQIRWEWRWEEAVAEVEVGDEVDVDEVEVDEPTPVPAPTPPSAPVPAAPAVPEPSPEPAPADDDTTDAGAPPPEAGPPSAPPAPEPVDPPVAAVIESYFTELAGSDRAATAEIVSTSGTTGTNWVAVLTLGVFGVGGAIALARGIPAPGSRFRLGKPTPPEAALT